MSPHEQVHGAFGKLRAYVEKEEFKGWDPYDGLTSKIFQATPLRHSRVARLAWIQFFKRSPVNFRSLLQVPKLHNPKGLGLFLSGYVNLHRLNPDDSSRRAIDQLIARLQELISPGYSGACWGYPFDWQARAFFQPAGTPTVVATTYVACALLDAFELLGDRRLLELARSSCDFVLKDLNRTSDAQGDFCFSYSPLDKTQVYNASLLGSRILARVYSHTGEEPLKEAARKSVSFSIRGQSEEGAWAYGTLPYHSWVDNFHTGFNLECLQDYSSFTGDQSVEQAVQRGMDYYLKTFFLPDGRSRYYNNTIYPIDIHSPAQLIMVLTKAGLFSERRALADTVMRWTLEHMQDRRGYFYYQLKPWASSRIPYMRWAQAWMFCAMTQYLKYSLHEPTN